MDTVFYINNLSVAYRKTLALKAVSMRVEASSIMAILGANGAGKSTLIKASMNLIPKLSGEIRFFGKNLGNVRKRISYMPQTANVDWEFPTTVFDTVLMGTYAKKSWLSRPGKTEKNDAYNALEKLELIDLCKRHISELSGGQQQRVFIARALVQEADIMFLDEPFAGVDITSENIIQKVLIDLKNKGKTIILVHHNLATVDDFCTHVAFLKNGDLLAFGDVNTTFTNENIRKAYDMYVARR